ncbi:RfbD dTDP-4-dehydrorhamnose reductase [Oxalobacteraceae bacterium]
MKVLVLGANGMIGSTMLRILAGQSDWEVFGTVRSVSAAGRLPLDMASRLISGVDLTNSDALIRSIRNFSPDVIVNCAGLTKHVSGGADPLQALTMNALIPHRLAELCSVSGARLIHVSTDCVFSGNKGNYTEADFADAQDVYGKTKNLGEVVSPGSITLRTSTIGHELGTRLGLLEWFLAQSRCKGYRRAIFSGLPTVEFARVVRDVVIPNAALSGLYHVGAESIDKESLLHMIKQEYGLIAEIESDDSVVIDRSLNSKKFSAETGYQAANWSTLIKEMHDDCLSGGIINV